jgi:hypothetical protein
LLFAQLAQAELAGLDQQPIPQRVVLEQRVELLILAGRYMPMAVALDDLVQAILFDPMAVEVAAVLVLVVTEVAVA